MLKKNTQLVTKQVKFKILTFSLGFTVVSTLTGLPTLAQGFYPPLYLFQPQAGSNYPYRDSNGDLLNTLQGESDFENLVDGLEQTGLTETLQTEQFTVLAPTDAAFDALPNEVFDKLSEPENLNRVLKYHLVAGEVSENEIAQGEVQTVEGSTVTIAQNNNAVSLNEATAEQPPIQTTNGVIIRIDKVLLPPDF